jgi:hypothetical protein
VQPISNVCFRPKADIPLTQVMERDVRALYRVPMNLTGAEDAAAEAINAELAAGYGPLSAVQCKMQYGAAFAALTKLLQRRSH